MDDIIIPYHDYHKLVQVNTWYDDLDKWYEKYDTLKQKLCILNNELSFYFNEDSSIVFSSCPNTLQAWLSWILEEWERIELYRRILPGQ